MKILITGINGAVGSTLVTGLKNKYQLRGLDLESNPNVPDTLIGSVADFDTVFTGWSSTLQLQISNVGNGILVIDSLYTTDTFYTLNMPDSSIDANGSAELGVTFSPLEFGVRTAIAYIRSNDPDESLIQISLSGFGYYPAPDIELSTNSINFDGIMDGLIGTQLLHVYNLGDLALELDTVYCTGNFSVTPSNGTVNVGNTLTLEVAFSPDDETSFSGIMTIVAGNDPDEDTLTVGLTGTGTQQTPIISIDKDIVFFGVVEEDQTSNQSILIQNLGMLESCDM